jgi:hypothetical protein
MTIFSIGFLTTAFLTLHRNAVARLILRIELPDFAELKAGFAELKWVPVWKDKSRGKAG